MASPPTLIFTDDPAKVAAFFTDAVAATFTTETARRQADRDPTRMTMSGLGGCTRANAYAVAGTAPSDVHPAEEGRAALLGVNVHDWLLPALARVIGATTVEQPVVLHAAGLTVAGILDLAFRDVVLDLKTVGEHRLAGVRRRGAAYDEHREQVFGYALAEYQRGRDVRWVVFAYLDRTSGDVEIVVEPFTNAAALAVIDRVRTISRFADDPDNAPRDGRGPGVSFACDRCPWLRRCWGPDATPGTPGAQTILADTEPGLLHVLELYVTAAAAASDADRDKEFAKLVLSRTAAGEYGPFKLSRGRTGETDDVEAMRQILAAHGIAVPKKPRAGATRVTPVRVGKAAGK